MTHLLLLEVVVALRNPPCHLAPGGSAASAFAVSFSPHLGQVFSLNECLPTKKNTYTVTTILFLIFSGTFLDYGGQKKGLIITISST